MFRRFWLFNIAILVLFYCISGLSSTVFGNSNTDDNIVQFSGVVMNGDKKELPFVHIIDMNTGRATISDDYGLFSMVIHPGDTILFSSVGYQRLFFDSPDTITNVFYSQNIVLTKDTVQISEINVYPWANYREFKEAFLQLDISSTEEQYARDNVKLIKKQIAEGDYKSADPGLNYSFAMQNQREQNYIKGQYRTISLLNPIAWSQFFEAIKNGDFSD
jgi:hypothetical protein